jgi:hypothetical protein
MKGLTNGVVVAGVAKVIILSVRPYASLVIAKRS